MFSVTTILLFGGGFVTATLAGITGFGGSTLLLPYAATVFGLEFAIPMLGIASLIGNSSRAWINRKEISADVIKYYTLGCIPFAIVGSIIFASTSGDFLMRPLGVLLILIVVLQHSPGTKLRELGARWFVAVGGGSGLLSGLIGTTGPFVAPFFLAAGLCRASYVGTEAASAVILNLTRTASYAGLSVMSWQIVVAGLAMGAVMIAGSLLGKRIVKCIPKRKFVMIVEILLVVSGIQFMFS